MTEGEVVPDRHRPGVQQVDEDALHVLLGAPRGDLPVEADHEHRVDAVACRGDRPLFERGEHRRDMVRPEDHGRMRVEGHHDRRDARFVRLLHRSGDEPLMSPVHPVEDPDGHRGAREIRRDLIQSVPDIHGVQTTTHLPRRVPAHLD